jgi:hypothetical protein
MCHEVKYTNYKDFLKKYFASNEVVTYFENKQYKEALYLLSMIDYVCTSHNLPVPKEYDYIRNHKLDKLWVSESVYLILKSGIENITELLKNAEPLFLMHNILEAEIDNVA